VAYLVTAQNCSGFGIYLLIKRPFRLSILFNILMLAQMHSGLNIGSDSHTNPILLRSII
jgi:hypothetical protein